MPIPITSHLDLWEFVRKIAPEQCAEFDRYYKACYIHRATGSIYLADIAKAHADVQIDDPTIGQRPEEFLHTLRNRIMVNRLQWRFDIEHLLKHELPRLVKEELLSGSYEITARRLSDQAILTLTARDMAALTVDVENKVMIGSAATYGEIAIRCLEEAGAEAAQPIPAEPGGAAAETRSACESEKPRDTVTRRGNKGKVWEAAQRHGRPKFSKRGALAAYVRTLSRETGVNEATVRNYVTKATELRPDIEKLPEASSAQKG